MRPIILILAIIVCPLLPSHIFGQDDTEFPKGFVLHAHLHSGFATIPGGDFDAFVGGIHLIPQYTVVPHLLRVGAWAGGIYTNKEINGLFGLTSSIKLKTVSLEETFGVNFNVNLSIHHLWGTADQKLVGGGLNLDLFTLLSLNLNMMRDYHFDNWWFTAGFGIRLSKVKDDDPFDNE